MKQEQGQNLFVFIDPPSQTNDEFESFLKNFELSVDKIHEDNPFMISVLGDFNAKSNNWCKLILLPMRTP